MAGSLIKINEEIVSTSAVATVTLTGIDSTYDVYRLEITNVITMAADASRIKVKIYCKSGTPNTTSNYDDRAMLNT